MSALAQPAPPVGKVLRLSQLIDPNPKQRTFLQAIRRRQYVLYGGAAGGGKSFILRWALLLLLLEYHAVYKLRNVRVGLFCEDYDSLRDRQVSKIKAEFPSEFGEITQSKDEGLIYRLHDDLGAGFISLRNLDDPSKYQSTEFAAEAVDELTRNPEHVFEALRMRLRWPGFPPGHVFPFMGATNPGGVGHEWVKRYWIDRDFPAVLDATQFLYIPALASDNPKLPADYEEKQLGSIKDEQVRRAFKLGDWTHFKGQFFHEWRQGLHVRRPFPIPNWWRRWRSSDWGFGVPWATGWFAMDPEGTVYLYRELYEVNAGVADYCREIRALSAGETFDFSVLDPACWEHRHDGQGVRQKSIAEQCAEAGVVFQRASNDRVAGWSQVRNYLAWKQDAAGVLTQPPRLVVFDSCPNLIRTLPALPYAPHRQDDADTKAEDHAPDMLRYGLMALPALTVQPVETMAGEDVDALARLQHADAGSAGGSYWQGVAQ